MGNGLVQGNSGRGTRGVGRHALGPHAGSEPLLSEGASSLWLIMLCLVQFLVAACSATLPEDKEYPCPCKEGWDCINQVCKKQCDDTCDCAQGFGCTNGNCFEDENAVHSVCGGGGFSVVLTLHGPPAEYSDLESFDDCDFLKTCYRLAADSKVRDCSIDDSVEWAAGVSQGISSLPNNIELRVVAECYDTNTTSAVAEPGSLRSRGESMLVKGGGGENADVDVYMLPPSSFGPTCALDSGLYQETSTFAERWGATAVEMYDGSILIAGGVDDYNAKFDTAACDDWSKPSCVEKATATAEIYYSGTGGFTLVGNSGASLMTDKRAFAAAVRLPSEEIAIFGGITNDGEPTNSVDIYNPITYTFEPGPVMQDTRAYHTATLISSDDQGLVLLVGGYGTGEATWEVWTPSQGPIADSMLNESRWHHTSTLVSTADDPSIKRNMVVIVGGEGGGAPGATSVRDTLEIFDIDANQLDETAYPLCTREEEWSPPAAPKTMHVAAFVPRRHFLYIAGGFKDAKHLEPTKDICVWHTAKETWSGEAGTFMLKSSRGALTATAMPGNVVLFAGGLGKADGAMEVRETVEIVFEYYNVDGQTVVDIGPDYPIPMVWPRWGHQALMGADGKVLVVGGLGGNVSSPLPRKQPEVFNPQY